MLKPDQIGVVACQDDFYVDEQTCLCCDAPPSEAPDLMRLGEENCFFYRQPGTQNEIERACRAINVSCVEGVRYRGQNRAILRRLFDLGSYASCDVVPTESEREAADFVQAHIGRTKERSIGRSYARMILSRP